MSEDSLKRVMLADREALTGERRRRAMMEQLRTLTPIWRTAAKVALRARQIRSVRL
ncbi:hypothetical protein [Maricaulis sp. CAU 1757]